MTGDDDRDPDERPRRSWREIDRLRDRPRSRSESERSGSAAGQARDRTATRDYLRRMDRALFARTPGGSEVERRARAVRDALGTPELAEACRAYLELAGPPRDADLVAAFLDAPDRDLVLTGLRSLEREVASGRLRPGAALRARLRNLAEGSDDEVAEAAEDVLAKP